MIRLESIRGMFFLVLLGYYAQGPFYAKGSIISQSFLVIMLSIASYFFLKTFLLKNTQNFFIYAWSAFLFLNVIGFIITADYFNSSHFGMLKGIVINSLVFFPIYYFAYKGVLKSKVLILFFSVVLPLTIMQYYFNSEQILLERNSLNEDLVNNFAYSFVWLMPYVFLFKDKKLISATVMALLMFFIIQGAKRGAVIAGGIALLMFIYFQLRTLNKKRWSGVFMAVLGVIGLIYFAYETFQSNEYLLTRINQIGESGGSGRTRIYSTIWDGWSSNESFIHLLFGFGFAASRDFAGNFAHNDWLELLSNFGLLGIFIYGLIFYAAIKYAMFKGWNKDKKFLMLTVVLVWVFTTLISMGYTNVTNGYHRSIILAFLIGNKTKNLQ